MCGTNLVENVVRARILHLHHHVCMQEVGLDHVWYKGGVFLLKHDGHNIVAYVPFPLQLKKIKVSNMINNHLQGKNLKLVQKEKTPRT